MSGSAGIKRLLQGVTIGEPQKRYNLTVFPLFAPWSVAAAPHLPFGKALLTNEVKVTESSEGGTVSQLTLANNLKQCVLLVDGEELIGAKQNRIVNLTILAEKTSTVTIPVSCVERGRWAYRSRNFTDSERTMYAKGRARKARDVSSAMRSSGTRVSDQGAVWEGIDELSTRYSVNSQTSAMSDVFEQRQRDIQEYLGDAKPLSGQIGAAFAVNGEVVGLELFGAEDIYAAYEQKIARSYAVEAMGKQTLAPPRDAVAEDVAQLITRIVGADAESHPGVSVGTDIRFTSRTVEGGALIANDALVHLVAFGSGLMDDAEDGSRLGQNRATVAGGRVLGGGRRPDTATHPLDIVRDHMLIHIDGATALVDTGSPVSFGRGRSLTLEGRVHTPDSSSALVLDAVRDHLGVDVEWLLGGDILAQHAMLLDWNLGTMTLPGARRVPGRGTRHRFELAMGVPVIRGTHRGGSIRAVLDSGAALSYAPEAAVRGLEPEGTYTDFYPGMGEFQTPVWRLEVGVGRRRVDVRAGVLPPMMQMLFGMLLGQNGWILGSDFFRDRAVLLDYSRNWVVDFPGSEEE